MEDSDTEFVVADEENEKKKNIWIQQMTTNLTLLHMMRLILLAMALIEKNAIQKKKKPTKKKYIGQHLRNM